MQLVVHIGLDEPLSLPINYNHILQAVIYRSLGNMPEYATFLHDGGFARGQRQYKMFQFSQLKGEYRIENKRITFFSEVSFEVRSPAYQLICTAIWIILISKYCCSKHRTLKAASCLYRLPANSAYSIFYTNLLFCQFL